MIQQGTPEWFAARAGKITASGFAKVMAYGKKDGKPLKARRDYIIEIVTELLTGNPKPSVEAAALAHGQECEPIARAEYEILSGNFVDAAGFYIHPRVPYVGGSPDGLVDSDGIIEIKCPYNSTVHVETVLAGAMPEEHTAQVQGNLWVTGRAWCDFISFDPRIKGEARLFVQRINRDETYINMLAGECQTFWAEVQATLKQLGGNRNNAAVEGSPVAAA